MLSKFILFLVASLVAIASVVAEEKAFLRGVDTAGAPEAVLGDEVADQKHRELYTLRQCRDPEQFAWVESGRFYCNPGCFNGERWVCTADPELSTGKRCKGGKWIECCAESC